MTIAAVEPLHYCYWQQQQQYWSSNNCSSSSAAVAVAVAVAEAVAVAVAVSSNGAETEEVPKVALPGGTRKYCVLHHNDLCFLYEKYRT